ncbi:MAG: DUF4838 domain-containing protein [Planctomycetota bacterium]|jgi:hypothetical protein
MSTKRISAATLIVFALIMTSQIFSAHAEELVLAENGNSEYQVVIPDPTGDKHLDHAISETGRLIQVAFKENGFDVSVVEESKKAADKPGIYIGNTAFAKANGIDVKKITDWSYYHKVVGKNIILAGHDHAPPEITDPDFKVGRRARFYYRLGTLKAVTDFVRDYAGTYFLYPGSSILPNEKRTTPQKWKLTGVANIEYKKMDRIAVPADLNLYKKSFLRVYRTYKNTVYGVANNFFPMVDDAIMGHTHGKAIPGDKYYKEHPEYFAMVGTSRPEPKGYGHAFHCYSNPAVQDLLYKWHKKWLDMGFRTVNILQPDGFRGCQCDNCKKLFGVGETNWAEKIWIIHNDIAKKLYKDYPDRKVLLTAYAFAQNPPETIKSFTPNVIIQNVDAVNYDTDTFTAWHKVHKGEYSCWSHNWCSNLTTRFTPMRTPLFLEKQVKWFYKNNNRGLFRDGHVNAYGLDGPSYYMFGRMFDDPESLTAKDIMFEFCDAAFGDTASTMRRFYDRIHYSIELYSSYLGTHGVGWGYHDIYGRRHKHVKDPFRFLGFLYPPKLLKNLEGDLSQAESKARDEKVKTRLGLVRREFDYLVEMMKVIHLHQAFEINPAKDIREHLLTAIDKRTATCASYYEQEGRHKGRRAIQMKGWDILLFPPAGYYQLHMQLNYDSYQHPFKNTAFNWDTAAVRKSPLHKLKSLAVIKVDKKPELYDPVWRKPKAVNLKSLPGGPRATLTSYLKVCYDNENLYIRYDNKTSGGKEDYPALGEKEDFSKAESLDIYLAPIPAEDIFYRFKAGPNKESKYESANGLITDKLNLLYGKDDIRWNGEWQYFSKVRGDKNKWVAMLTIPFKSLGVEPPKPGDVWRGNFGRNHPAGDKIEKSVWSAPGGSRGVDDRSVFGNLEFSDSSGGSSTNKVTAWRAKYYKKTFEIPEAWKDLKNQYTGDLSSWRLKFDALEKGVKEKWYAVKVDDSKWPKVKVPAFWAETEAGNFEGNGWYRKTLDIPAEWKGKKVKILFGSVDEEAWVYFNGKLAGEHNAKSQNAKGGDLWEAAFEVELNPKNVKYGQKNLIAVRVYNSKANGGIWRPVKICAVD